MWQDNDDNTAVEDMFARTAEETTCSSYSHHSLLLHPCWIGVREPVKRNTIIIVNFGNSVQLKKKCNMSLLRIPLLKVSVSLINVLL